MAFSIKNDETDRLARELASETGESLTEAVTVALRERLERQRRHRPRRGVADALARIRSDLRDAPILDDRPEDEILGYDEHGLPS